MENQPTPAGGAPAPQTESTPTNINQVPAPAPEAPKMPNMHGFTEEQLADMEKFYNSVGGYEQVKSRLSNPQKYAQPQEPASPGVPSGAQTQQAQPTQPTQQEQEVAQPAPQPLPKGYITRDEIVVKRYFEDLAKDPRYANISDQIANGSVLKEMSAMGMIPIDENLNINQAQLNQFLALKAASVPAKQTSVEPTNIPTVEYVPVENDTITSTNQALQVLQQSMILERQGQAPHPAAEKAREFIKKNGL